MKKGISHSEKKRWAITKRDYFVKEEENIQYIDDLGRVVLPAQIRQELCLHQGVQMDFFVLGNRVVLKKHEQVCTLCRQGGLMQKFRGKPVCQTCIAELKKKNEDTKG